MEIRASEEHRSPLRVLIAGGGVAALEMILALRQLAAERVSIELLAPEEDFVYRPAAVAEPFGLGHARTFPLATIAIDRNVPPPARHARLRRARRSPRHHRLGREHRLRRARGRRRRPDGGRHRGRADVPRRRGQRRGHRAAGGPARGPGDQRRVHRAPGASLAATPLRARAHHRDSPGRARAPTSTCSSSPTRRAAEDVRPERPAPRSESCSRADIEVPRRCHPRPGSGDLVTAPGRRHRRRPHRRLPGLPGPPSPGLPPTAGFIAGGPHGRVRGSRTCTRPATPPPSRSSRAGSPPSRRRPPRRHRRRAGRGRRPASRSGPCCAACCSRAGSTRFLRTPVAGDRGDGLGGGGHALWWPPSKIAGRHLAPYLAAAQGALHDAEAPESAYEVDVDLAGTPSSRSRLARMRDLSDLLGRPVLGPTGERVGRVADLLASPGDSPVVVALRMRRRGAEPIDVPWEQVEALEADGAVRLRAVPAEGVTDGELLHLRRDVLDTQIVDVAGRRVVRAATWSSSRRSRLGWWRWTSGRRRAAPSRPAAPLAPRPPSRWTGRPSRRVGARPCAPAAPPSRASTGCAPRSWPTSSPRCRSRAGSEVLEAVEPERAAGALGRVAAGAGRRGWSAPWSRRSPARSSRRWPWTTRRPRCATWTASASSGCSAAVTTERATELRRLLEYPADTAGGLMTPHARTAREGESAQRSGARLGATPPRLDGLADGVRGRRRRAPDRRDPAQRPPGRRRLAPPVADGARGGLGRRRGRRLRAARRAGRARGRPATAGWSVPWRSTT